MIESAQAMLAGIFPPQQHENWETTINWQPIGNCEIHFEYDSVEVIIWIRRFFSRAYDSIRPGVFAISTKGMRPLQLRTGKISEQQ